MTRRLSVSEPNENTVSISGTLHSGNLAVLLEEITRNPMPVSSKLTFELAELEIEDGLAVLTFASLMQALRKRVSAVSLRHPPDELMDYLQRTSNEGHSLAIEVVCERDQFDLSTPG